MTEILINATQPEEIRVAMTENGNVFDFDMESIHREDKKASVYKGIVSRVEASLNAVFVDYGADRHGFLPLKEIAPEYFQKGTPSQSNDRFDLRTAIKEGQELIIQISKEERGSKGAALSTFITLAGCYLVLMPNNESAGGISRRIEGEDRQLLKDAMEKLEVPEGMGVIIRTNGLGRSQEELQWDLNALIKLANAIKEAAVSKKAPFLIYRESDVISRTIRDYLRADISQITVDTQDAFDRVMTHVNRLRPEFANKVFLYKGDKPLFIQHHIEHQIETAYQREVKLPSGGSIVIDHTEALVSIDINSSKATKGEDIEETALQTNLEAAMEIARQARLRDIGGLIVIDFIDMLSTRHQRDVETQLQDSLKKDRARVQTGRISRFGLLEMSRQRLRPSLDESTHITCPRCTGQGTIRGIDSLGLSILRLLEEDAASYQYREFQVELPVSVATFLLNEKRQIISQIETKRRTKIILIPNQHMETPHYEIKRFKHGGESVSDKSYELISKTSQDNHAFMQTSEREEAAITGVSIDQPPKRRGLITRLLKELFSSPKTKSDKPAANQLHSAATSTTPEKPGRSQAPRNNKENNNTRTPRAPRAGDSDRRNAQPRAERPAERPAERSGERPHSRRQNQPSNHLANNTEELNTEKLNSERPEQSDRQERAERTERPERKPRAPRAQAPRQVNQNNNDSEAQQAPAQSERRPERTERPERAERSERSERPARAPRAASPSRDSGNNNHSQNKSEVTIQSFDRYEVKSEQPSHQISPAVQELLQSNNSLVKDTNAQQAETLASHQETSQKQKTVKLKLEVQEEKTNFSLEAEKERLAAISKINIEQVGSKQTTNQNNKPAKIQIESQEV